MRFYAVRACEEGVLFYPVYALLFADAGLSTAQISTLFVLWSVVSFAAEIPSGAWADTWSRRRLYAVGAFLTAAGYASWTLWPAYAGFALGFVLWGLGGALCSGTLEALLYDQLGDGTAYARMAGRGGTVAILAMLLATVLASPAYAIGGYLLVGALSVAARAAGGIIALGLPDPPRQETDDDGDGYLATLKAGLGQARTVGWAVAIAALVPGFTALDEYLPLLSRDMGASTTVVPLMFGLVALAMAGGSALAGRWARISSRRLAAAMAVAAGLLAVGALSDRLVGMVPVAAAFGILQYAIIVTETRLQEAITGPARTTVLSVAGFASEVFAVLIYAGFGLGAPVAPVAVLVAACGLPLLATAGMILISGASRESSRKPRP